MESVEASNIQSNIFRANFVAGAALELKDFCSHLAGLVHQFIGATVRSGPLEAYNKFNAMPRENQVAIIQALNSQADFIASAIAAGLDGHDEIGILKHALGKLRLIGSQDVIDKIEQDDVIEVLDENSCQVYRSFSCFDLCNYSLEELASYPWYELYDRSSKITQDTLNVINSVIEGKCQYVSLSTKIPEYTMSETRTEKPVTFIMKEKFMAALVHAPTNKKYVLSVKRVRELPLERNAAPVAFI